jgi:hypothetical protein
MRGIVTIITLVDAAANKEIARIPREDTEGGDGRDIALYDKTTICGATHSILFMRCNANY